MYAYAPLGLSTAQKNEWLHRSSLAAERKKKMFTYQIIKQELSSQMEVIHVSDVSQVPISSVFGVCMQQCLPISVCILEL